jgi:hypothetical protein
MAFISKVKIDMNRSDLRERNRRILALENQRNEYGQNIKMIMGSENESKDILSTNRHHFI